MINSMSEKQIKIVISEKDLRKYNINFSASGLVIDELAFSAGLWTEEDVFDNNYEYSQNGFKYVLDQFDFEAQLLAVTKTAEKLDAISKCVNVRLGVSLEIIKKTKKHAGAWFALKYPVQYARILEAYEAKAKEDYCNYRDNEFLNTYVPKLVKELEESEQLFWDDLTREWLHGDRKSAGVINTICRYWDAEAVEYNHDKGDKFVMYFNTEDAKEKLEGWNGKCLSATAFKDYLLVNMYDVSQDRAHAIKHEQNERRAKREELAKYKEEQKAKEDAKRIEMLKSLMK